MVDVTPRIFPPQELTQPLPRSVMISVEIKLIVMMIVTMFTLIALWVLISGFSVAKKKADLQQKGIVTTAIIKQLYTSIYKRDTTFKADYSFVVNGDPVIGRHQRGTSVVEPSDFATLRVGDRVGVTYLPTRPDIAELTLSMQTIWADPWISFKLACKIACVVTAVCLVIAGGGWGFVLRERRLVTWGAVASARIVGEKLVHNRGGTSLTVTYEFRDQMGRLLKGTRAYVPAGKQLDNPTVLYDPGRPSRNLLYPPLWVKCEFQSPVNAAECRTNR